MTLPYIPNLNDVGKFLKYKDEHINIVFNYNNSIKKNLLKNKSDNDDNDVGVYEIPCQACNMKYYGESGRGLHVRIAEHKRAWRSHSENSALVKHSWDNDHRIDWNNAKIIFKSSDVNVRRLVEGAAINMGSVMEGNKPFTQEDFLTDFIICKTFLKNFNFKHASVANPDPSSASLSPVQVAGEVPTDSVAGAYPAPLPDDNIIRSIPPPRRSRRIAGLAVDDDTFPVN